MKIIEVKYKRVVHSKCAIKYPNQNGINISRGRVTEWTGEKYGSDYSIVSLNATNPRTNQETTHLELQIPIEDIDSVIEALKAIKDEEGI